MQSGNMAMCSALRAIILAAGRGRRIGSLTEDSPKCLLEIDGRPILEHAFRSLALCNVPEVVLVVGYQADKVQRMAGRRYQNIHITYLVNERYAETNTAYSLWLARHFLNTDCLLVEGDILFDAEAIQHVLLSSHDQSAWAAVPITDQTCDGILIRSNGAGHVSELDLVREARRRRPGFNYKCAGIQLVRRKMAQSLAAKLDSVIQSGQVQRYADLVLGELLHDAPMMLCSLEHMRWAEVDDLQDLHRAQQVFASSASAGIGDLTGSHSKGQAHA